MAEVVDNVPRCEDPSSPYPAIGQEPFNSIQFSPMENLKKIRYMCTFTPHVSKSESHVYNAQSYTLHQQSTNIAEPAERKVPDSSLSSRSLRLKYRCNRKLGEENIAFLSYPIPEFRYLGSPQLSARLSYCSNRKAYFGSETYI